MFGGFSLMPPENRASVATHGDERCSSELESQMSSAQIEQKRYEMPPREGFTVTHFITVADIDRSADFYEKVFGGRFLNIRFADIRACYELWKRRGAEFITEPMERYDEIRCYIRNPDGYIIEVGQSTDLT
jgi:hypothetical protein